jgi:TPR repeat protein
MKRFFLLVDETEGRVLKTTKDPRKAVEWYINECKHQYRWYNPAVYVFNKRVYRYIPDDAVPILSTYNHLPVSELREGYLTRLPEDGVIRKAEHLSL